MLTIDNTTGARIFTVATVYVLGDTYATLRSLGEVSVEEMTDYLNSIFEGFTTNHLGTTNPVLGDGRFVDLGNGVEIAVDVNYIDGGLVNCHTMSEWEATIKRASKLAKKLEGDE